MKTGYYFNWHNVNKQWELKETTFFGFGVFETKEEAFNDQLQYLLNSKISTEIVIDINKHGLQLYKEYKFTHNVECYRRNLGIYKRNLNEINNEIEALLEFVKGWK